MNCVDDIKRELKFVYEIKNKWNGFPNTEMRKKEWDNLK